jgi:pimeloyl-ACP methyl ester carboxylesterase
MRMTTPASTPKADHTVTRADGRHVAWAEWGNSNGQPVVFLHRNPGSRLLDPDSSATGAADAWLITIDRPGFGRTDPVADPKRSAVAADIDAVVRHIGVPEVALIGWSGGGMFALEAAAALGTQVRSLSLVCTPAPDDEIPWVPDAFRSLTAIVKTDPAQALASIAEACSFYAENPEAAVESDPVPADAEVRARPEIADPLRKMMREGARQGAEGMAADIFAASRGEPLPLGDVRAPVRLWYGDADWIDPKHGRWYADQLATAELNTVPGAGHLLPLTNWRAILDAAISSTGNG